MFEWFVISLDVVIMTTYRIVISINIITCRFTYIFIQLV